MGNRIKGRSRIDTDPWPGPTGRTVGRRAVLTGAAALGLDALAAACAGSSTRPGAASTTSGGPPDSAAVRTGFAAAATELRTPGAAMLLRTPNGDLTATFGTRRDSGGAPVTLADHVRIGSVTKTFTGTVILQLAQEGKLDIDAPLADHRPDVPNARNITLAQLLDMRSGLYNYSESLELNKSLDDTPSRAWHPEELVALGLRNPPYFPPGTGYHYSNTNTVLLGLIAEQVDKQPLASSFQSRLFTPLAMPETSFPAADSVAIPDPHPQGYQYGTNVGTMASAELPPDQQAAAKAGTLKPNDVTTTNPSWTWAAGGGISTIADLVTWVTALGDGKLLNPTWQQRRLASIQSTNPQSPSAAGYGLALAKFGPMYGHTGELPGFQTFAGYDPDRKYTLLIWTNLNAAPDGRPPATTIAIRLFPAIYR